jgi:hypothetical protein
LLENFFRKRWVRYLIKRNRRGAFKLQNGFDERGPVALSASKSTKDRAIIENDFRLFAFDRLSNPSSPQAQFHGH